MAKIPERRRPEKVKIPYKESSSYLATFADGGLVTGRHDDVGSILQLLFTRAELTIKSEEIFVERQENMARQVGASSFVQEEGKTVQCSVSMRPDHALGIATAIITHLNQMPEQLKYKYNIPKFDIPKV